MVHQRTAPIGCYEAVLIHITQAKRIVKTEIQGCAGTVKEYIGTDDFKISINGIITGANRQHPALEVAALKKMLEIPCPVPVVYAFLENLGIYSLSVESYEIGQQEGGMVIRYFDIHKKLQN